MGIGEQRAYLPGFGLVASWLLSGIERVEVGAGRRAVVGAINGVGVDVVGEWADALVGEGEEIDIEVYA